MIFALILDHYVALPLLIALELGSSPEPARRIWEIDSPGTKRSGNARGIGKRLAEKYL